MKERYKIPQAVACGLMLLGEPVCWFVKHRFAIPGHKRSHVIPKSKSLCR